MENKWYFFSAQGNYSHAHNWNNGYTSVTVEKTVSEPRDNSDFASLYEAEKDILFCEDSYGGSHSAWGYVFAASSKEAEKVLMKYLKIK